MIEFEQNDFISLWIGTSKLTKEEDEIDILKEWGGVEYYDKDLQEFLVFDDYELVPIKKFLENLSYSECFIETAINDAKKLNIKEARWAILQVDFKYDPQKVSKKTNDKLIFLGVYPFEDKDFI